MEYKETLTKLLDRESLTMAEAALVVESIIAGECTPAQIAGLLVALRMKGEAAEEVAGFVQSLRRHVVSMPGVPEDTFDTCGTGGDGMSTFNISTATALVIAACGVKVAKHGNRSVSSSCGSADVLEALGVNINLTPEQAGRCLHEVGIVFLFAPLYHPAFAHVGPVRKELGVRTLFNVLGPLVNPAFPPRQIVGVSDAAMLPVIAESLRLLDSAHALVVRSTDGYDELTTTAVVEAYEVHPHTKIFGVGVKRYEIDPRHYGFARATHDDLKGGTAQENAAIIRSVLFGEEGPRLDTVLFNSGAALYTAGRTKDIAGGIALARAAVESGKAIQLFGRFMTVTQSMRK